jgi:hypothetical protein
MNKNLFLRHIFSIENLGYDTLQLEVKTNYSKTTVTAVREICSMPIEINGKKNFVTANFIENTKSVVQALSRPSYFCVSNRLQ